MRHVLLLLLICLASGCSEPALPEFGNGEQKIYLCTPKGKIIVTDRACDTRSQHYLRHTGGGIEGGMVLFIDLCEAYRVTAFGYFHAVGEPPFDYRTMPLRKGNESQVDSLRQVYNQVQCRHIFYTQKAL